MDASTENAGWRARQQAHDRQRGDTLAAAGLAGDPKNFALFQTERYILDRRHFIATRTERRGEIANVQQAHGLTVNN